ncbi:phosphoribosylamine--glycine ligase [Vagococcus vulneris]|uniref:Phosphoribosylamine--glycine ligase n=1 Tax=Vagococcus vulneris TaxID=1977869 RepID=A0A429ZX63_9ENTE|nr:phosphoribosylamine--glycine ligase [Vagococcus vulneris]RST98428.1 phosphoribosylamine--glycine ligase [Vagococcus vulneris]
MKRNILVIGSGGREHAICKKFLDSSKVNQVFCAKGNDGMKIDGIQVVDILENKHEELINFAKERKIDWVLIGPENPLMNGLVDDFEDSGIKAFGPKKSAALIEGSKEFAKELMTKFNIPTAEYKSFSDFNLAYEYVKNNSLPIVIKADGLAAGKGVVIAETYKEAKHALKEMLVKNTFNNESPKVVIEEFLVGEELSLLSFVNETGIYPMATAKDYKAIFDNNKGPNTGGMGAYSPVEYVTEEIEERVLETIIKPTINGMKSIGTPFTGVLYTGLILTTNGPKVIEYNARFGDPETQVLLERLDSDLIEVIESLLNNKEPVIKWKEAGVTLGVVVSAKGYPNDYETDISLPNFKKNNTIKIFYSGVKEKNQRLFSDSGRVFLVTCSDVSQEKAQEKVYTWLNEQNLSSFYYRHDIGGTIKKTN